MDYELTARDELFFRHEAALGIVIPEVEIYLMHMIPSGPCAERLRFSLQHASAISEIPDYFEDIHKVIETQSVDFDENPHNPNRRYRRA